MTTIQPLLHHMEAAAPPSQPTQHTHYSGTVQVPTGAYDIIFQCAGGAGGRGGKGGSSRSNGGAGMNVTSAVIKVGSGINPPFTVFLWPGTAGVDAYDPPVGDATFPNGCSGWSGGAGGSSAVGMSGGTGGSSGGTDQAGSKSCNVGGGGSGGAASMIQISVPGGPSGYAIIAGGGGGGGGSSLAVGSAGGSSNTWHVGTGNTSPLGNSNGGNGEIGTDTGDEAGGGGGGGGMTFTSASGGAKGGPNAGWHGDGGDAGKSGFRNDIVQVNSWSQNTSGNGWTALYYKTP